MFTCVKYIIAKYLNRKAFTSHTDYDSEKLKKAGVDLILSPFIDGARDAAEKIATLQNQKTL